MHSLTRFHTQRTRSHTVCTPCTPMCLRVVPALPYAVTYGTHTTHACTHTHTHRTHTYSSKGLTSLCTLTLVSRLRGGSVESLCSPTPPGPAGLLRFVWATALPGPLKSIVSSMAASSLRSCQDLNPAFEGGSHTDELWLPYVLPTFPSLEPAASKLTHPCTCPLPRGTRFLGPLLLCGHVPFLYYQASRSPASEV